MALYGLLASICLVLGFVESNIAFFPAVPGVKPGLANSVALLLVFRGDWKGAFAVNISRILLSTLLFSTPFALVFSLSGGIASLSVTALLAKCKHFSAIGCGIAGAAIHNLAQLTAAQFFFGAGVWGYLPFLLLAALISGGLTGGIAHGIMKKMNF